MVLQGSNTHTQFKDELDSVYGDSSLSFTTVKFWAPEFKRGLKSLGNDERSGRPNTATTNENIAKVHQMVLDDHRIKTVLEAKREEFEKDALKYAKCLCEELEIFLVPQRRIRRKHTFGDGRCSVIVRRLWRPPWISP
ncbi:HTH_48 domain-containing protein [Trichonephila clavipes]|nr:HTH_48 domain-containing protein [Trichonephila clavipes]